MDPYERLAAINEALQEAMMGNKPKPKVKKENPVAKFSKAVAGIEKKSPEEVAAKLAAFYDKQDKSIFGESTEKIDQEFGAAKKALKDAGIEHDALQAIGSMDREKNTFKISKENMRKAREVLKKFPNAQIKRS